VVNDSADVTSYGRSFHVCELAIGKARLPTVDSLLVGGWWCRQKAAIVDCDDWVYVGDTCERNEVPGASPWTRRPIAGCYSDFSVISKFQQLTNNKVLKVILERTDQFFSVFTARCTLVQSAVLRSHVVCLSVRLSVYPSVCMSVCDVGEL